MILFGSTAVVHWFSNSLIEPNDIDYLVPDNWPYSNSDHTEYHKIKFYDQVAEANFHQSVLLPDLLYTIKVSHLPWEGKNGKWWKHLKDAVYLKSHGCKINEEIYALFYEEWEHRFGDKSHITFDKSTEDFFADYVTREYDHDWVHHQFMIGEQPAYKLILKNEASALCSKEKFFDLEFSQQCYTALEEMFVIAFERNISLPDAYKALVTRMTKGWWNRFLIENAATLLNDFTSEKNRYKLKVNSIKGKK